SHKEQRMNVSEDAVAKAEHLLNQRKLTQALKRFNEADALRTDTNRCAVGRWMAHMLLGKFQLAWRESDAIRARTPHDPNRFWRGEDLHGKRVVLRCLHGFGDAVQFLRFVPWLYAIAADVIVEVPPKLLELAPMFAGVEHVITWGEQAPPMPPEWDVQVEINELPYLFRLDVAQLPIAERYLRIPPAIIARHAVSSRQAASLKVGVVWAGGEWNPSRSIPFEDIRRILHVEDCEFWNLQGGTPRSAWPVGLDQLHAAEGCEDSIVVLAALIAQMDLMITSDTLAAHLAGAQGVPCWVILRHAADWRWMHTREDSPWYPSIRLFRCGLDEGWGVPMSRVTRALHTLVAQRRAVQEATAASSS
ncbi:MAG: hypothetical protein V4734_01760, partial [Terriglobus sp.]